MATYVKGTAVENATSYELYEKAGDGTYTKLATDSEINFDVSALELDSGDHTLVVKATATGYLDSDYSNEVVYTITEDAYTSYMGADVFKNTGIRVTRTDENSEWTQTKSGSTSFATDFIEVNSNDSVWIQYVFVMTTLMGVGGFYDAEQNLIAPLYYDDFGLSIDVVAKFATPEYTNRVSVADIEAATGETVKYVRFIAWSSSNGGQAATEARIYSKA